MAEKGWEEEEYTRLWDLKNSRRPPRWLEIANDLNRPVREVKQVWRDRSQWMKPDWDERKVPPPLIPIPFHRLPRSLSTLGNPWAQTGLMLENATEGVE